MRIAHIMQSMEGKNANPEPAGRWSKVKKMVISFEEKLQEKQAKKAADKMLGSALSLEPPEFSNCALELISRYIKSIAFVMADKRGTCEINNVLNATKTILFSVEQLGTEIFRVTLDGDYYYDLYHCVPEVLMKDLIALFDTERKANIAKKELFSAQFQRALNEAMNKK